MYKYKLVMVECILDLLSSVGRRKEERISS